MATNVLEVQVKGDISDIEKKLSDAEKLQKDYENSIKGTQKAIADNIRISKQYEKAIEQLNKEYKAGNISGKKFQKQLQKIQKDEAETEVATKDLRKELVRLKRNSKDLGASTGQISKGFRGVKKGASNATPTVIEFSRVIQDAPYGIQGVANNIQQLTTNFGYLQKSAGGTLPALKALGKSFLGPAGIVFAVSTITSLLVTYGDKLLSSTNKTKQLIDATKEYLGSARAEVSTLKVLVAIATDEAKSKEIRQGAIDKINEEYGDYLGNLDLESIKTDKVRLSIDRLSVSLIKQAKLRGIEDLITEEETKSASKILDLEQSREKALTNINKLRGELKIGEFGEIINPNTAAALEVAQKRLTNIKEELTKVEAEGNKALQPFLKIQKRLQEEVIDITPKVDDLSTKTSGRAKVSTVFDFELPQDAQKRYDKFAKNALDALSKNFNAGDLNKIEIDVSTANEDIQKFVKSFDPVKEKLKEVSDFSKLFSDSISNAFSAMASELASSVATGNSVLDAFVGSFIQGLAQIAQAELLGLATKQTVATAGIAVDQARATSNAVVAGTETASASGPAAAFVLPALIGAAIGFVAAAFSGIKFAQGGIVPGGNFNGDRIPALVNSGEMILNSNQQSRLFALLDGNLSSLNSNANQNNELNLITVIKGEDILLSLKRTQRRR